MDNKLQKRLKALLAMSQDTSSEHEALIAARRLHALLSKHNMSLTDLEMNEDKVDSEGFETVNFPYRRIIAKAIANLYYCDMYFLSGYKKNYTKIVIIGKENHRMIASAMTQQVYKIIDHEANRTCREKHGKYISNYVSSFRNGAANRIFQRCENLIRDARQGNLVDDETGENLPALASLYDQEQLLINAFKMNLGLTKTKRKMSATNPHAMEDGFKAGGLVPLHQGLKQTAPKLLK